MFCLNGKIIYEWLNLVIVVFLFMIIGVLVVFCYLIGIVLLILIIIIYLYDIVFDLVKLWCCKYILWILGYIFELEMELNIIVLDFGDKIKVFLFIIL